MGSLKSWVGVIGAFVGVLYFGGLIYYFLDISGSVENAVTLGLGPDLLILGGLGLLLFILLMVRINRLFGAPRSPGPGRHHRADASTDEEDAFDADATIARYLASRSKDSPAPPRPQAGGEPAKPPSFGRKAR